MINLVNSKWKGSEGERELAGYLRQEGYKARRGQQYSGVEGKDVLGVPGVHIEVKRTEKLRLSEAMSQSRSDAGEHEIPVVAHRRSREPWLVTMLFEDWVKLYREHEASMALKGRGID